MGHHQRPKHQSKDTLKYKLELINPVTPKYNLHATTLKLISEGHKYCTLAYEIHCMQSWYNEVCEYIARTCKVLDQTFIKYQWKYTNLTTELETPFSSNQCCLFLHVTTLSDIAETHGTTIQRIYLEGTSQLPSPFLWPIQTQPPAKAWRIWRQYLARCYLLDDNRYTMWRHNLLLHTPLGRWLPSRCTLQHRDYYLNPTTWCI